MVHVNHPVTDFSYAVCVLNSGSLFLNGLVLYMLVQLLLLSFKGKEMIRTTEDKVPLISAWVHVVPPLWFIYGSSYGVMPFCSALRELQG